MPLISRTKNFRNFSRLVYNTVVQDASITERHYFVSIGIQTGPLIGAQKGPLCAAGSRPEVAELSSGAAGSGRRGPGSGACLEAPAFVAGLDDVAVMGEPVEERGRHLGVAEDRGPFAEVEVRRHDDRGAFVEAAYQVEQELAAGLGKGEIAEFIQDQEVEAAQQVGRAASTIGLEPMAPAWSTGRRGPRHRAC